MWIGITIAKGRCYLMRDRSALHEQHAGSIQILKAEIDQKNDGTEHLLWIDKEGEQEKLVPLVHDDDYNHYSIRDEMGESMWLRCYRLDTKAIFHGSLSFEEAGEFFDVFIELDMI